MPRAPLIVLCLVALSLPALAHHVIVFAYREGNRVRVESKFSGGDRVHEGKVTVTNASGEKVNEGVTDASGDYAFDAPGPGALKIEVYAGEGHQGEWKLAAVNAPEPEPTTTAAASTPSGGASFSRADLQRMIEDAVEVKVAPLRRMLITLSERDTDWRNILGGLGWIAGVLGIIAYYKARRNPTP